MRKFILLFFALVSFAQNAFCEIFVDYEPESLKNPIPVNTTQSSTQSNSNKSLPEEQKNFNQKAPALPAHLKNDINYSASGQNIPIRKAVNIKKSTKFELSASQNFSDKTKSNAQITFSTTKKQSAGTVILPQGTVFKGHIIDAHTPQLTSNGGLIKVAVDEIIYENISNDIQAKVLSVNGKRIFFNNIKGERKFIKNTINNTKWGRKICKKSYKTTFSLYKKGGAFILISPIPAIYGTTVCAANCVAAPAIALFQKGNNISIKSGSKFIIKLNSDAQIYVIGN